MVNRKIYKSILTFYNYIETIRRCDLLGDSLFVIGRSLCCGSNWFEHAICFAHGEIVEKPRLRANDGLSKNLLLCIVTIHSKRFLDKPSHIYTVSQKKFTLFLFAITRSFVDRF